MVSRLIASTFFFAVVVVAVSASGYYDACENAFRHCDFRFEGQSDLQTFSISGPDNMAFTPRIISTVHREVLGVLNTNNIVPEFILSDGDFVKITERGHPNFKPTAFKPFSVPHTLGSGIGHQTFHGDQRAVATGQCVRVFFSSYQVLKRQNDRYIVIKNVNNVSRDENKCVVFRT